MEKVLTGGNMNTVIRSGGTVRRPSGPWTPTVHGVLEHVASRGVDWVPRAYGLDERGRELLDFLPGEVPSYPMPGWVWADSFLVSAARHLRVFHDATADIASRAGVWQVPAHPPVEVICHNDFAPYNFVCTDHEFAGVIDFDTMSPGSRIWDVCYLAYRLCPLTSPENPDGRPGNSEEEQDRRLALLLSAYDAQCTPAQVITAAIERLHDLANYSQARAQSHGQPELSEHAALYKADAAYLAKRSFRPSER